VIRANADHRGAWEWRNGPEDEAPCASIGSAVRTGEESGFLKLLYTITIHRGPGTGRAAELTHFTVDLVTARLPTKGLRWWFTCPDKRVDATQPCRRRVGTLYLPSVDRGTIFACRDCYGLTYKSCRESRNYPSMWNSLGASCGMSGKRAKKLLDGRWNGERKLEDRLRQRAVFSEAATNSDIRSTSMDSVN
jgi:hypothetical protein